MTHFYIIKGFFFLIQYVNESIVCFSDPILWVLWHNIVTFVTWYCDFSDPILWLLLPNLVGSMNQSCISDMILWVLWPDLVASLTWSCGFSDLILWLLWLYFVASLTWSCGFSDFILWVIVTTNPLDTLDCIYLRFTIILLYWYTAPYFIFIETFFFISTSTWFHSIFFIVVKVSYFENDDSKKNLKHYYR